MSTSITNPHPLPSQRPPITACSGDLSALTTAAL